MRQAFGILVLVIMFSYYTYTRWEVAEHLSREEAPEFSLEVVRGKSTSLSRDSFVGKPVVMNFWATWCHACKEETPILKGLHEELAKQGVRFLGVASYDEGERVKSSPKLAQLPYEIALDASGDTAAAFGIHALPQTVVIGSKGRILYHLKGRLKKEDVKVIKSLF